MFIFGQMLLLRSVSTAKNGPNCTGNATTRPLVRKSQTAILDVQKSLGEAKKEQLSSQKESVGTFDDAQCAYHTEEQT